MISVGAGGKEKGGGREGGREGGGRREEGGREGDRGKDTSSKTHVQCTGLSYETVPCKHDIITVTTIKTWE